MRTILLDADIVAYKVAAATEERWDFNGDGNPAVVTDEKACRELADKIIGEYCDAISADRAVICLSDSVNWRKQLDPTYKAHREKIRRPEMLALTKAYLAAEYQSYIRPRLEADDIMGILATRPALLGRQAGEVVMVSEDKDMRQVPAKLYDPNHPEVGIIEISPLDADRFHMYQTVVGDPTDGYPGCPGAGPKAAEDILFADRSELWDLVLFEYCSRGYTEADAIHQARLAHVLRATDYNFKTKQVRLWNPLWLYEEDAP